MKQVILPIPATADPAEKQARRELGSTVSQRVTGCTGLEQAVQGLDSAQVADVGTIRLGEMPENVRAAVASLEVGQVSAPLEIGDAFIMLVICDKEAPKVEPPTRRTVAEQLGRQRAALLAHRYLRDLRRAAVVELR
jgi:peptidyl-prolyl cis-trans isomerase SurA